MPFLNTIDRKTVGYTDDDLDDTDVPKEAKHVFTADSGHHVYHHAQGSHHEFFAVNPETKKIDQHFKGLMRHDDNTYDERSIHGRKGSTLKADELYDNIRTKLGYNIRSDTSHSRAAKKVWERIRKRAGGKLHYQPMSGGEVFAGKAGLDGRLDVYYGPGKGVLVAKASKK
jgi:hypothetical protein